MFDYSLLLGKIRTKYGSQSELCRIINLSTRSLSLKLTGKIPFKQPEIKDICYALDGDLSNLMEYFFTPNVHKTEQIGENKCVK